MPVVQGTRTTRKISLCRKGTMKSGSLCHGKLPSNSERDGNAARSKWETLKTMRRYARLSVMYKMCYGFLDGQWEDYLIPNRERRTPGSHDFKFIVPKGHKDIFRLSFSPRPWLFELWIALSTG